MPREKSSPHRKSLPETQQLVKEMCLRDNCCTQNEFIEKAIRFYAGYISGQEATAYLAACAGVRPAWYGSGYREPHLPSALQAGG